MLTQTCARAVVTFGRAASALALQSKPTNPGPVPVRADDPKLTPAENDSIYLSAIADYEYELAGPVFAAPGHLTRDASFGPNEATIRVAAEISESASPGRYAGNPQFELAPAKAGRPAIE
ncbi:MAG: hypothetical protein ACYC6T_04450 [Thermoleophilia bacterium]